MTDCAKDYSSPAHFKQCRKDTANTFKIKPPLALTGECELWMLRSGPVINYPPHQATNDQAPHIAFNWLSISSPVTCGCAAMLSDVLHDSGFSCQQLDLNKHIWRPLVSDLHQVTPRMPAKMVSWWKEGKICDLAFIFLSQTVQMQNDGYRSLHLCGPDEGEGCVCMYNYEGMCMMHVKKEGCNLCGRIWLAMVNIGILLLAWSPVDFSAYHEGKQLFQYMYRNAFLKCWKTCSGTDCHLTLWPATSPAVKMHPVGRLSSHPYIIIGIFRTCMALSEHPKYFTLPFM